MIFANSSAPMNAQSSSSCSLEFLRVKCLFFFVQVSSLHPNSVIFIEHEVWPNFGGISEPFALGKRRRSASGCLADRSALNLRSIGAYAFSGIVAPDRSACIPRSIGDASGWLRVVEPIDRLMSRDRSAIPLPFWLSLLQLLPIDRLLCRDRSAMALSMWSRFPLLQNVPFCILFHLGFRTCA